MVAFLLAQVVQTDPISGGAGWVGAGLLGAVLAWLLFIHLPAKDKYIKDLVDRHDEAVKAVAAEHKLSITELTAAFTASLDKVVEHCKDEMDRIIGHWAKRMP